MIEFDRFREIADEVGAKVMVDMAHIAGLIAAGAHPNPVPHADVVAATTHKTLRGPRGGIVLSTAEFAPYVDKGCPLVIGGPLPHIMGAKAVALKEANSPEFKDYAKKIVENASALAAACVEEGLTIATGGTDNHLMLLDLRGTELTGKVAQETLDQARITVNKNAVPFDTRSPFVTSGVRIGTPAVTSRGMEEAEMDLLGDRVSKLVSGGEALHNMSRDFQRFASPDAAKLIMEDLAKI